MVGIALNPEYSLKVIGRHAWNAESNGIGIDNFHPAGNQIDFGWKVVTVNGGRNFVFFNTRYLLKNWNTRFQPNLPAEMTNLIAQEIEIEPWPHVRLEGLTSQCPDIKADWKHDLPYMTYHDFRRIDHSNQRITQLNQFDQPVILSSKRQIKGYLCPASMHLSLCTHPNIKTEQITARDIYQKNDLAPDTIYFVGDNQNPDCFLTSSTPSEDIQRQIQRVHSWKPYQADSDAKQRPSTKIKSLSGLATAEHIGDMIDTIRADEIPTTLSVNFNHVRGEQFVGVISGKETLEFLAKTPLAPTSLKIVSFDALTCFFNDTIRKGAFGFQPYAAEQMNQPIKNMFDNITRKGNAIFISGKDKELPDVMITGSQDVLEAAEQFQRNRYIL